MQDNKQLDEKELELALEQAKATRLELEQKAAEEQQRAEQARREREQMDIDKALKRALSEIGIKFHPTDDDLKKILDAKWQFNVAYDGILEASDRKTGGRVDFAKAVVDFVLERPFLADQRTLKRYTVPEAEVTKSDFETPASKASYIQKFGLAAWEALPLRPTPKVDVRTMTAVDWANLPNKVKSQLIAKYGQQFVSDVLRRKS